MKLLELNISGFGKLHNRQITFHDGLNVVYGKNEAGKSTIHTFIRGMLFGLERQRGRAARNDLYSKYEPWENSGTYEGQLRLEHEGHIYRIERNFQKSNKNLNVVDETLGKEIDPTNAFWNDIICGLSETAYNNTISIGQLKSATDAGMVSELKNYIANLNTTGNMALNITKASSYLKTEKKKLENQLSPEASRSYAALLGEIRKTEAEISSPEYENQLFQYQKQRSDVKETLAQKQVNREQLLERFHRGKTMLDQYNFSNQESIQAALKLTENTYKSYEENRRQASRKIWKAAGIPSITTGILLIALSIYFFWLYHPLLYRISGFAGVSQTPQLLYTILSVICGLALSGLGIFLLLKLRKCKKNMQKDSVLLADAFKTHLGDGSISEDAMKAYYIRMDEFIKLSITVVHSEEALQLQMHEISKLQEEQNNCSELIERQQKIQWELEKQLDHLSNCRNQAEALKHIIEENDRLRIEIDAIDLAQETMTDLSTSIRDSFGLYLNKTASDLIKGITGGIYSSLSIDENLNVFMNTRTKLVPLEQVSSGTMDQIYLALRLAAAKLIQDNTDQMPLIFDDSFVLYDDERLATALTWIIRAYQGQIIIFTCHQRETEILDENLISYHLVRL